MRLVLDFETYYDQEYTLKKMYTLEYIRDDRFLIHGAAVKVDEKETQWLQGDTLTSFIEDLPKDVELICHNTYFDGLILFHHYRFSPKVYRDTLSMARALLIHAPEHNLNYLCNLLGVGEKTPGVLHSTKGLRTLSAELAHQLGEYAINDVNLTDGLYEKLLPGMPEDELALVDLTMRWGCRPILQIDKPRILKAFKHAVRTRRAKIRASGATIDVLSSQVKFRELLEELGINVPYKTNKNGKQIPALSKSDLGFKEMIADNPEHISLFDGRMAAKSTLEVTRTRRLYKIGMKGTLPMPLKFYGAHTGRWSGTDGLNPQNWLRDSELRKSIIAPPGYVILVADLKQIEARINMWFCSELDWLSIFAEGKDIYKATAASHFGIPYEEVTKSQRFFGKTLELGLGYNMGWRKFRMQLALRGTFLTEEEAYRAVAAYRNKHSKLVRMWHHLTNCLSGMFQSEYVLSITPIVLNHEGILLPNGMRLDYAGLVPVDDGDWRYGLNGKSKKIYGGLMLENIIQALARIVLGEYLLKIEEAGITTVSSTHDEPIMIVREKDADEAVAKVKEIMTTPPDWALELPVAVDVGYAKEYSK